MADFEVRFKDIQSKEILLKLENQSFLPNLSDTINVDGINYKVVNRVIAYAKNRVIIFLREI